MDLQFSKAKQTATKHLLIRCWYVQRIALTEQQMNLLIYLGAQFQRQSGNATLHFAMVHKVALRIRHQNLFSVPLHKLPVLDNTAQFLCPPRFRIDSHATSERQKEPCQYIYLSYVGCSRVIIAASINLASGLSPTDCVKATERACTFGVIFDVLVCRTNCVPCSV